MQRKAIRAAGDPDSYCVGSKLRPHAAFGGGVGVIPGQSWRKLPMVCEYAPPYRALRRALTARRAQPIHAGESSTNE